MASYPIHNHSFQHSHTGIDGTFHACGLPIIVVTTDQAGSQTVLEQFTAEARFACG